MKLQMVRGEEDRTCQTGAMLLSEYPGVCLWLTKHHGLGNDFLVLFAADLPREAPFLARNLCHRTRGIGADGLIFGLPHDPVAGTDTTMVLFNADGSRAEMSGNGIRCLAQAWVLRGGVEFEFGHCIGMRIGTDAGIRDVQVEITDKPGEVLVHVDMGPVSAGPQLDDIDYPEALRFAAVDVGNPHLVIQVPDVRDVDVAADGEKMSRLAGDVNVEFISLRRDWSGIDLRVWERGVGVTEACGTGACAAAHVAHDWGLVGPDVLVSMPGGDLEVELGSTAVLVGPAVFVARLDLD